MKKSLLAFALVALMAAPAMAELNRTVSEYLSAGPLVGAVPQARSSTVYQFTNLNGYYNTYRAPDLVDGELCQTIEAGSWLMDGFGVAWAAPAGSPQTKLYIDFHMDDGYMPWSGNLIRTYTIPVVADGYLHTAWYDLTASPLGIPTSAVWVMYSWDVQGGPSPFPTMGPAHVGVPDPDPGAAIGTDIYEDGWINYSNGWKWSWYGGNPSSDLYVELSSVPEPATLALLALGAFALIRRR